MMHLLGEMALWSAWCFAGLQCSLPIIGVLKRNPYCLAVARPAACAQSICVWVAFALLVSAFITNDFSIAYVAENSHATLPLFYRMMALWGAHEGSVLLWIISLSVWTMIYTYVAASQLSRAALPSPGGGGLGWGDQNHQTSNVSTNLSPHPNPPPPGEGSAVPLALAILGMISFAFLSFLLFTSDPFASAMIGMQGQDLNPLLQDPGFMIHPPILYVGYVGFAVPFAMTEAALLTGKLDERWATLAYRFTLATWSFLTLGIVLGSWWAYRVLGWGGFWFWDPVENASLLPWLAGVALIHVLALVRRRKVAIRWASLLTMVCFALSLLGTFLVRSGVLVSVHAFANDPRRGLFLLLLLAVFTMLTLIINWVYAPESFSFSKIAFPKMTRATGLLLNSVCLIVAMLTVLLGTLYPLILDALHLNAVSVGAPYFNMVMTPLVFIVMGLMGFYMLCSWEALTFKQWWKKAWQKIVVSIGSACLLVWYIGDSSDLTLFLGLALSFWAILSVFWAFRLSFGASVAHIGFAILIVGILLSSVLTEEKDVRLRPGLATTLGPYQFFFVEVVVQNGPNYRGIRAVFDVLKNKHVVTQLHPEKRIYTVRNTVMTKVDIHPGLFRDLYIALGEPLPHEDWSLRIYYKPFIRWVWLGGLLMMLGGLCAILI